MRGVSALSTGLAMLATLAVLPGCRAPTPHGTAPTPPAAAALPDSQVHEDASYDWHGLLIAPFGSVLKNIPIALHEVLLFRDESPTGAPAAGAGDDEECYASDAPAPRFVGRVPEEYVLCFKQDRLARVQASVRLTAAEAPEIFAAACAGWLKKAASAGGGPGNAAGASNAGGPTNAGGTSNAAQPGTPVQGAGDCEGRDGVVRFSAHLGEEAGRADPPATEGEPGAQTLLSIKLDSSADL